MGKFCSREQKQIYEQTHLIRKNVVHDKMAAKVQSLADGKKLEMEDVDNLVLEQDLKAAIYTEKVKMIAQEEIQKAVAN